MTLFQVIKQYQYGVAALVIIVLFFHLLPDQGLVYPSIKDAAHTLVFGVTTYLLLRVFLTNYSSWAQLIGICFFTFLLGVVIELIQPYVGRDRSLIDVYNDFAGCSAAGLFYARRLVANVILRRIFIWLSAGLVLSGVIFPALNTYTLLQRNMSEPILINFDRNWELALTNVSKASNLTIMDSPADWQNMSQVAKVDFGSGEKYPGISFPYIYETWSKYSFLKFEVFSEQKNDQLLVLRIHDDLHQNQYHDRFNKKLTVKPGLNQFVIALSDVKSAPKLRELQLDSISSMAFFMVSPEPSVSLYFDNLVLQ